MYIIGPFIYHFSQSTNFFQFIYQDQFSSTLIFSERHFIVYDCDIIQLLTFFFQVSMIIQPPEKYDIHRGQRVIIFHLALCGYSLVYPQRNTQFVYFNAQKPDIHRITSQQNYRIWTIHRRLASVNSQNSTLFPCYKKNYTYS